MFTYFTTKRKRKRFGVNLIGLLKTKLKKVTFSKYRWHNVVPSFILSHSELWDPQSLFPAIFGNSIVVHPRTASQNTLAFRRQLLFSWLVFIFLLSTASKRLRALVGTINFTFKLFWVVSLFFWSAHTLRLFIYSFIRLTWRGSAVIVVCQMSYEIFETRHPRRVDSVGMNHFIWGFFLNLKKIGWLLNKILTFFIKQIVIMARDEMLHKMYKRQTISTAIQAWFVVATREWLLVGRRGRF